MIYAQIKDGIVLNTILLDSYDPLFLDGFDFLIDITSIDPMPSLGWFYDSDLDLFITNIESIIPPLYYPESIDWSRRRDIIQPLFLADAGPAFVNFPSLTLEKKLLACTFFFIPYAMRITLVSEEQDFLNWQYLLQQTKRSRTHMLEAMRLHVGEYVRKAALTLTQTQQFFKDLFPIMEYFERTNSPDLKLWLTDLSPYSGIFSSKDYFTTTLRDELLAIYNGNY